MGVVLPQNENRAQKLVFFPKEQKFYPMKETHYMVIQVSTGAVYLIRCVYVHVHVYM